jgi:pimeloyl-ACP methyl ester carboxylesterase
MKLSSIQRITVKRQDCNSIRSVWPVIVVVVLSASFTVVAETEPNNTRAQANVMAFNPNGQATMTGRINPLSDLDFFSITTPSFAGQATLVITMTPTSADRGLDARIQLQNTSGTVLTDKDVGFDNAPETNSYNQSIANTTYFVVCRSADIFDAGSGDYTLQISLVLPQPNLVPYQPPGWSDKIVVSKATGTASDSAGLTSTNILYVDWAVSNSGNTATINRFYTAFYIDGVLNRSWFTDPPLNADFFVNVQDYEIGPLSVGTHSLRIITDSTGTIPESNESDNEFTKTITVLDDDLNDQLSGALALGALNQTLTMPGGIDAPTDVDMFSFTVVGDQRVSFDVDQTSGLDSYIRLFDASGVELAANDDTGGPGETTGVDSYLEYTFTGGGTFYVGVSGFTNTNYNPLTGAGDINGSAGSYALVVSPGLAGTIRRPGDTADYLVDILGFGANPSAIKTNQGTWIVIHGWNSSRTNGNIFAVASALSETRPGDQVLTLDWRAAADVLLPFAAEDSILPVAELAASALVRFGFSGTNLNLVGHSFGSYVSDEIAQRIPGGVNTIITLDPAADVLGGYDSDAIGVVDFAVHSLFSWSFHSSSVAGNEYTPTTSDESFVVESGADPITAHGNVVFLFAYILMHSTDIVSQFFLIADLLQGKSGPWLPDQYSSLDGTTPGYEARITTSDEGKVPQSLEFVKFPSLSLAKSGNDVVIAWPAYYTDFALQSSTLGGQFDPWTDVSVQPSIVGQFNVVILPRVEAKRFFRLVRP